MTRFVIRRGLDGWRAESATVELHADGLTAVGTQLGSAPRPYRLDYRLDAGERHVTRSLEIVAVSEGRRAELGLRHDGRGRWRCRAGARPELDGALDCDLGFSPLTNAMPVRRSGLHRRPGAQDFLMAWIAAPELRVVASAQRYEHVSPGVVRYVDRGAFAGFAADLDLDDDGLVVRYPGLAERVR